jgi:hypothetical protein
MRIPCVLAERQSQCVWLHNNNIIFPIAGKFEYQQQPDNGDCSLFIRKLDRVQHNGTWQCQVPATSDHHHLHSTVAEIIVLEPPGKPTIVRSVCAQKSILNSLLANPKMCSQLNRHYSAGKLIRAIRAC